MVTVTSWLIKEACMHFSLNAIHSLQVALLGGKHAITLSVKLCTCNACIITKLHAVDVVFLFLFCIFQRITH